MKFYEPILLFHFMEKIFYKLAYKNITVRALAETFE